MVTVGIAGVLRRLYSSLLGKHSSTWVQHYQDLLLTLARKFMENFKFRQIWVCTLNLPLLIHIISQRKQFRISEFQQLNIMPRWGTWTKLGKPRQAGKPHSEGLISCNMALCTRLEYPPKNFIPKGHTLPQADFGAQVVYNNEEGETKMNAKIVLK